jgi:hypothetical protein
MDYCWSADGEMYNFESLNDLIQCHDELTIGSIIYRGEAQPINHKHLIDADDIIETIGERAYDMVGECADDYPHVTKDARTELTNLVHDWIERHVPPNFWTVMNIKEYTITENDME